MNVSEQVAEIDAVIRQHPWMDFEVAELKHERLTVIGSIDPSADHDVEIIFTGVSATSLPLTWRTDTSATVLTVLHGPESVTFNQRFRIEVGQHLFCFAVEDRDPGFRSMIAAAGVELVD